MNYQFENFLSEIVQVTLHQAITESSCMFQGLLELLNVPGDKFLNGSRTSTIVRKSKLAELARES